MHRATSTLVLLCAVAATLGSASPVFLGAHTVFATPSHTPLLHLGPSYSLEVPFATPATASRTAIFPTQAPGTFLYFAEGGQPLLGARTQQPHHFALEGSRFRSGNEQAPQGFSNSYLRTSQDYQSTHNPGSFLPETRVSTQDFPVSPQRQDFPSSRTSDNVQSQNFAGRSSVQEFPVEDRRTQLAYSARPSQSFQDERAQGFPEGRRIQQTFPENQAAYSRGPVSQGYLENGRANEDFSTALSASPYPEGRSTPVYTATPAPVTYPNNAATAYSARPTARTFSENSPAQEYPVSSAVQGYSQSPVPQTYSQQTSLQQAYARTSVPQGYSAEQFQEDAGVRQAFPETRTLPVSRGYPVSRLDLQQPRAHHTYSVNFEGSGFGYGYTVQRQQVTTPTPPHFGHSN